MQIQNFLASLTWADVSSWFLTHGLRILGIIVFAWILNKVLGAWIPKLLKAFSQKRIALLNFKKSDPEAEEQRVITLQNVILGVLRIVIWLVALVSLLPDFGIEIGPILAGLGIIGLALGLASQTLIRDYIAGLFILLEDQYRVGDDVEIAGVKGRVRNFTLRCTILEDKTEKSVVHFIPNSQVSKSANFSRK